MRYADEVTRVRAGLVPGPSEREVTEQGMRTRRTPDAELRRMVRDGELVDAATVAAYAMCVLWR